MQIPAQHRPERNEWVLQFINIVFLILLFFLVNATIQAPPPQGIAAPVSIMSDVTAPPSGALFIDRTGALFWNKLRVQVHDVNIGPQKPRALYADKNLQAQKLITLIAQLRQAGLQGLPLITVRSTP